MPEVIDCPSCRRKLRRPEGLDGQLVRCPACATTFTAGGRAEIPFAVLAEPVEDPLAARPDPATGDVLPQLSLDEADAPPRAVKGVPPPPRPLKPVPVPAVPAR